MSTKPTPDDVLAANADLLPASSTSSATETEAGELATSKPAKPTPDDALAANADLLPASITSSKPTPDDALAASDNLLAASSETETEALSLFAELWKREAMTPDDLIELMSAATADSTPSATLAFMRAANSTLFALECAGHDIAMQKLEEACEWFPEVLGRVVSRGAHSSAWTAPQLVVSRWGSNSGRG
jgi:hypothetical protein